MVRSPKAYAVEPEILIWGRKTIGLTKGEAAKKAGVKLDTIENWESGLEKPTIRQLEKLANAYKRTLTVFFLDTPPEEPPFPKDFRKIPSGEELYSKDTRLAIREAMRIQRIATGLLGRFNEKADIETYGATKDLSAEFLGSKIRTELKIDIDTQHDFGSFRHALKFWRDRIENENIAVLQFTMPTEETRAFSLTEGGIPTIVLNSSDSVVGRIFSLIHEYCHMLINEEALCNWTNPGEIKTGYDDEEIFCNAFAASFLIPKEAFLSEDIIGGVTNPKTWDEDDIIYLTGKYKVSKEAILRRLLTFDLTTKAFYEGKRKQWQEEYKKRPKQKGGAKPEVRNFWANGRLYSNLVFKSYYEGFITYADVSDFLRIDVKYLNKIEGLLRGG